MRIVKPSATLLVATPDAEQTIERAGRTCYKSEERVTPDSEGPFILKRLEWGHESIIEHASATILLVCDRGVSHELVRHRIASFSQESTRYCNYAKTKHGGELCFIAPPIQSSEGYGVWLKNCEAAEAAYLQMIDRGESPQIARSILPNCLKTEIVVTANLREWRHILRLRLSKAAHPQMRELMQKVAPILIGIAPNVFQEFQQESE